MTKTVNDHNDADIGPKLEVAQQLNWFANQHQKQQREIRAGQNHEDDDDILDRPAVVIGGHKMSQAGVVSAEPSCGHRAKRVTYRVKGRHAEVRQDQCQDNIQHDIDRRKQPGRVLHSRV